MDMGDFNGDGFADLVVANGNSTNPFVTVYFGTGTGLFGKGVNASLPEGASSIVTADFNNDGVPDVATAAFFHQNLSILLGVGNGTFQDPVTSTGGGQPLAAADLNGDGVIDLITSAGPVYVHLGNGDGTFALPSLVLTVDEPLNGRLAVADFDGDGHVDLAGSVGGRIGVLSGRGDGTFGLPLVSPLFGYDPTAGDFNRDGKMDLVVANDDHFQILLGIGNGDFSAGQILSPRPGRVVVTDFDRDGIADLGVAAYGIDILLGRGDGTLGPPANYATTADFGPIVSADFDGDGFPDVAVLSGYFSLVEILLSQGAGAMRAPPHTPFSLPGITAPMFGKVLLADFTGDDIPDAVVSNQGSRQFSINRGTGDGGFASLPNRGAGSPIGDIGWGDFDTDGKTDLLLDTDAGVIALLGNGDGTFRQLAGFGSVSHSLVVGDFDGDGKPDAAQSKHDSDQIEIYLGNGDGTFGLSVPFSRPEPSAMAEADFNGDGTSDLAVMSVDNQAVWIALGGPGGNLSLAWSLGNLVGLQAVASGDVNGDSKMDVVVSYDSGLHMATFLGHGDGSFSDPVTSKGTYATRIQIFDINGDGLGDLVIAGGSFLTVRIAAEEGSFGDPVNLATEFLPAFTVGDVNADGRADLVAAFTPLAGSLTTFLNTRCEAQRIGVSPQAAACDVPSSALGAQPVVRVLDDGDNVIACDMGTVTASIPHGTGTAGAVLSGTTSVSAVAGVATFTDLSIDQPGAGYRLQFSHPVAGITHGRTLSQGLTVLLNGPTLSCDSFPPTYRTGSGGYDRYLWKLDDAAVSRAAMPTLAGLSEGDHTLEVTVFQDGCTATDSRTINVSSAPPPPFIGAPLFAAPGAIGLQASVQPLLGSAYLWTLSGGTMTAGQGTPQITFNAGAPGTTMVLEAFEISPAGCESPADRAFVQVDFADAGSSNPFHDAISAIARNGISKGCGGGNFCPDDILTRAQMAIFLLRAEHGGTYQPPALGGFGTGFADVNPDDFAAAFITQLRVEKITLGCGSFNYCPNDPVTRAQMAIFLLRTEHGANYMPPDATGTLFTDVKPGDFGARFIEQLAHEGISGGCGNNNFCPNDPVSRAQMAAFLRRTFNLP